MMRLSSAEPITTRRLEQICVEVNAPTSEGREVLAYIVAHLMPAPPEGLSLAAESVDQLLVSTGHLSRLADRLAERSPRWLGVVMEFRQRMKQR